jgi:hypothetical protein
MSSARCQLRWRARLSNCRRAPAGVERADAARSAPLAGVGSGLPAALASAFAACGPVAYLPEPSRSEALNQPADWPTTGWGTAAGRSLHVPLLFRHGL